MVDAGYVELIAGTGGITECDLWGTIEEQLHDNSKDIAEILQALVRAKTPIMTGALLTDINYDYYTQTDTEDIAYVYAEQVEQQAYWNRVYVQYQEGGLLGEQTYTNDPREMFFLTAITDGPLWIGLWASAIIAHAETMCDAGVGVPWKGGVP